MIFKVKSKVSYHRVCYEFPIEFSRFYIQRLNFLMHSRFTKRCALFEIKPNYRSLNLVSKVKTQIINRAPIDQI